MMKNAGILFLCGLIIFAFSRSANAQDNIWTNVAPGVWKTIVGTPDKLLIICEFGS